jgi:hypothetical protein
MYTQTAPFPSLALSPPISAVPPSPERATLRPKFPLCESRPPCCFQDEPLRVKTQAAPSPLVSVTRRSTDPSCGPPTSAVEPSADSATLAPKVA